VGVHDVSSTERASGFHINSIIFHISFYSSINIFLKYYLHRLGGGGAGRGGAGEGGKRSGGAVNKIETINP